MGSHVIDHLMTRVGGVMENDESRWNTSIRRDTGIIKYIYIYISLPVRDTSIPASHSDTLKCALASLLISVSWSFGLNRRNQ